MPHKDPEARRAYHRAYGKKWDEENPEARRAIQQRHDQKRYDTPARQEQRNKARWRRHVRLRIQVIEQYGGRCNFCPCTQFEHLTIDHIDGSGKTHRAEIGRTYGNIYEFLARTEYRPDLYRLLCWNCHMAMTRYGVEPGGEDLHDLDYWREQGALRRAPNG